jgi:hypothetical protein
MKKFGTKNCVTTGWNLTSSVRGKSDCYRLKVKAKDCNSKNKKKKISIKLIIRKLDYIIIGMILNFFRIFWSLKI